MDLIVCLVTGRCVLSYLLFKRVTVRYGGVFQKGVLTYRHINPELLVDQRRY